MDDFQRYIITPELSILDAMSVIDNTGNGIAFICDEGKLVATLTDGDVRRHILNGKSLDEPVGRVGNVKFQSVRENEISKISGMLAQQYLSAVPVLNSDGFLVDIVFRDEIARPKRQLNVPVVIQAGGKGTRLYPYTKVLPKPLVPVGDLPITEHIMKSFLAYGCSDFTMIVNYKRNMIKAYFADEELPYLIKFVEENTPLGTGGGLGLLRDVITETFFMTNCDILVFEDYAKILQHHQNSGNMVTMVCTTQTTTIPYGIVEVNETGCIRSMTEKPSFSFLTNTGLYVIEPSFLQRIPVSQFTHITSTIQDCIDAGEKIGIYPIGIDKWSDMGQPMEMEKMLDRLTTISP